MTDPDELRRQMRDLARPLPPPMQSFPADDDPWDFALTRLQKLEIEALRSGFVEGRCDVETFERVLGEIYARKGRDTAIGKPFNER